MKVEPIYSLEFKQNGNFKHWHYNRASSHVQTNGWHIIASLEPDSKLRLFTNFIDCHYTKELHYNELSPGQVREEWIKYCRVYDALIDALKSFAAEEIKVKLINKMIESMTAKMWN